MSIEANARALYENGAVDAMPAQVFTVRSGGNVYTTIIADNGEDRSCTCEHGKFRGWTAECKHVHAALIKIDEEDL